MKSVIDQKITSEKHGMTGMLVHQDNSNLVLRFTCKGELVILPVPMVINEQTLPWLEPVAEMMIDHYVERTQTGETLDSLFDGGVAWH